MADLVDDSHPGQPRVTEGEPENTATTSPNVQQWGTTHTVQVSVPPNNDPHGYYHKAHEMYCISPGNHYLQDAASEYSDYQPYYQTEHSSPGSSEPHRYPTRYRSEQALPGLPSPYVLHTSGPSFSQAMSGQAVGEDTRPMPNLNRATHVTDAQSTPVDKGKGLTRQDNIDSDEDIDPIPRNGRDPYNQNLSHDSFGDESLRLPTRKRLRLVDHEGRDIWGDQAVNRSYGNGQSMSYNVGPSTTHSIRRLPVIMSSDDKERSLMYDSSYMGNSRPHRARPMFFPRTPLASVAPIARAPHPNDFYNVGQGRSFSKASGMDHTWETYLPDKPAERVTVEEKGRAAVMKRRLPIDRDGKVPKRAYGINDPENIQIVNLYENDHLGFNEISRILNNQRIREGRKPSLSICGIHARYNRTAPLLFASERKIFVPLRQRRKQMKRGEQNLTLEEEPFDGMFWNPDRDCKLVEFVKQVDSEKWKNVADMMSEHTNSNVSIKQVVNRWNII